MMKWLRWQGIALFMVLTAVVAVGWFILVDRLVKTGIEEAGTRAVGARVELASADLSLFPIGLKLERLQVTDPEAPMTNMVEIAQISLLFELDHLIRRKVVVKEMAVADVRFSTPRKTSGALTKKDAGKQEEKSTSPATGGFDLPKLGMEDIDTILKREKLLTLEAVEKLKADVEEEKKNLDTLLKNLPDQKTFDQYKTRIDGLQQGGGSFSDIMGKASGAATLKEDIEKDLQRIQAAQKDVQTRISKYQARAAEVSRLPAKDFERLKNKYALSSAGMGNLAQLLLGPRYGSWIKKGLGWYEKARPYLDKKDSEKKAVEEQEPERGKGIDVAFKEDEPVPALLIRQTRASLTFERGVISGEVMDITSDQTITGKPTTYTFSGKKLQGIDQVTASGKLAHYQPGTATDTLQADITGFQLVDIDLGKGSSMPVTLNEALADARLTLEIKNEKIKSRVSAVFRGVQFDSTGKENDPLAGALKSALAGIDGFSLDADLIGTLDNYEVKVESDLDQRLKKAVSGAVREQAAVFEKQLMAGIQGKTTAPLSQVSSTLGGFGDIEKEINSRLNLGNGLLGDLNLF